MKSNEIIAIAIGILLSGFGVFFGQFYVWGYLLVVTGIICLFYVAYIEYVSKKEKVYTKPREAFYAAKKIYNIVLEQGGIILATHIFPANENILEDMAVATLKYAKSNRKIEFRRILIVEDPAEERRIVETLFNEIPNTVDITLHVLARYPLGITRLTKTSIPRFNMLLHQSENTYSSLLGLDDLSIPNAPKTNFAVQFKDKASHISLKSYFSSITSSSDLIAIRTIQQYNNQRSLEIIPLKAHQAITKLVKCAEQEPEIICAALFGSIAKFINDVFPDSMSNSHDMDIDVILICESTTNIINMKNEVEKRLNRDDYHIIWGDNEIDFYTFRSQHKINIDIEIFRKGDDFYKRNHLLSYSIFRYFFPLYFHKASNISDYIPIQKGPLTEKERWIKLVKDRKGYVDFKKSLSTNNLNVDPRRVLSLVLRNFVWASSGHYPATAKICIEYLRNIKSRLGNPLEAILIDQADEILSSDYQYAQNNQSKYLETSILILDKLCLYAYNNKINSDAELGSEVAKACTQPTNILGKI